MVSRKRNSVIYRFASLLLVLMLSACSALQGTPQPAPPVTDHPQEIRRDQTQGLQRIGSVSTMVRGSPDDALAEIRAKAVAAKADYYVVVMVDETIVTGRGIHKPFCTVNKSDNLHSQLYIALRPYAFTCAQ